MSLNKKQAADALFISLRTLERRMKAGQIRFTKAAGQFGEVSFTYADLGLPEPTPAPRYNDFGKEFDEPTPTPQPKQTAPTPNPLWKPDAIEKQREADLAFAERYKMGEVTDSYGNKIDRTNARCPESGVQCGVTPAQVEESKKIDSQAHMSEVHKQNLDVPRNPIDTDWKTAHPEEYAAAMANYRGRYGNIPSMSEMAARQWRDKGAILSTFPRGNATTASRGLAR